MITGKVGSKIDFSIINEAGQIELVKLLSKIDGIKAIVWDKSLAGTIGLLADFTFLKKYHVSKMFFLSPDKLPPNNMPNIIFIVRPTRQNMDLINNQIRREGVQSSSSKKEFYLWCVPRITVLCQNQLRQHGIYNTFNSIDELPLYLFPLENDLVTMDFPLCYRDSHLDLDPSGLFYMARALMTIQATFGLIPSVFGKGDGARRVFDLMVSMRRELGGAEPQVPPQIDQLILIDRKTDLISALATQLTYEGLIDQFFAIRNCSVKLPADRFAPSGRSSTDSPPGNEEIAASEIDATKVVHLSSSDTLFSEIRDFNFFAVGPRLSNEAKEVSQQFEKRHTASTVSDLKEFVQTLPKIQVARQSLSIQTTIAELVHEKIMDSEFRPSLQAEQELLKGQEADKVNPYIEECLIRKDPLVKVLRLICLQSVVNCGLKPKVFEFYKREIINTYGFEHLATVENLERAGLLVVQQGKATYSTVRKTLRLTVDDVNESKPTDISYVHSGYAPLSVRLVEFLQYPGWRAITEVLNVLPGSTLCETQQLPSAFRQRRGSGSSLQGGVTNEPSTALVCFIGGCTYAEVAALRFLASKIDQGGPEYAILTTSMINGNSFVESLLDDLSGQVLR